MNKFVRGLPEINPQKEEEIIQDTLARFPGQVTREHLQKLIAENKASEVWLNDTYQVNVYDLSDQYEGFPVKWLSIKRLDKEPCRDWRDFQEIKNQLVGPECEGIELYPAESRLADTSNQYHLWCIADPRYRFPFGWFTRCVDYTSSRHSKQRGLSNEKAFTR